MAMRNEQRYGITSWFDKGKGVMELTFENEERANDFKVWLCATHSPDNHADEDIHQY